MSPANIFVTRTHLLKSDFIGILSEALTAHVQSIFPDETMSVTTYSAAITKGKKR